MVAASSRGLIHSADHLGEELAVEIGEDDADCARLAGDEGSCAGVWDVAESRGDFTDAVFGGRTHGSSPREHAGHGGDGDTCFASDVLDGDHGAADYGRGGYSAPAAVRALVM